MLFLTQKLRLTLFSIVILLIKANVNGKLVDFLFDSIGQSYCQFRINPQN